MNWTYWRKSCAVASAALAIAGASETAHAQEAGESPDIPVSAPMGPDAGGEAGAMSLPDEGIPLMLGPDGGPAIPFDNDGQIDLRLGIEDGLFDPFADELPPDATEPMEEAPAPVPPRNATGSPLGGALNIAQQSLDALAPTWIVTPSVTLEEIFTDNARNTHANHQSDFLTTITGGIHISADTVRLQGIFDYSATIRRAARDTRYNNVGQYGFATLQATVIPNMFFLDVHGTAHEVARDGLGLPNPALASPADLTQAYSFSASPDFKTRVGYFGIFDVRYAYSRLWLDNNRELAPNADPFDGSEQQQLRADLRMPGTLAPRLLSDIVLSGTSSRVKRLQGGFRRAFGELVNEYQITRSISAIGGAGYETFGNKEIEPLNGEGAIWDLGARWRPNPDSSVMVLYGRHDQETGISGEVQWRFTPVSAFYAAHTDSITSSQQSFIENNFDSLLGPEGPSVGVTFDQNPTISTLKNQRDTLYRRPQDIDVGSGLPLFEVNNYLPFSRGFFRLKQSRAALYRSIGGEAIYLSAFHLERTSLINDDAPIVKTNGFTLAWSPVLSGRLIARAEAGYRVIEKSDGETSFDRQALANAAGTLTYQVNPSFSASIRYDYTRRVLAPTVVTNAVSIRLGKSF